MRNALLTVLVAAAGLAVVATLAAADDDGGDVVPKPAPVKRKVLVELFTSQG